MYPKRAAALFIALILMLSAVTVRLFYLSMGALPGLDTQAGYAQYSRTRTAAVRRGLIYDRNFQPLAGIHSGWLAVIDHAAFDYDAQGEALCRAAGIPLGKLKQYRREGVPFVLPVEENISSSTIYCLPTFVRRTDSIAAHVIGYLNSSGQGVCGLEAAYDSLLNAYGGRFSLTYQVNAIDVQMGNSTLILTDSNYYSAGGVVTTLDRSLQQGIESSLSFVIPADFEFLKRSGRLTTVAARVGGVLKLLPILTQTEDKKRIRPVTVKRSWRSAVEAVLQQLRAKGVGEDHLISVCHAGVLQRAQEALAQVQAFFPNTQTEILELSPALMTHGGPGCIVIQSVLK